MLALVIPSVAYCLTNEKEIKQTKKTKQQKKKSELLLHVSLEVSTLPWKCPGDRFDELRIIQMRSDPVQCMSN